MKDRFILFDSDSLKSFHKRIFFSIILFSFLYFIAIYRISDIMIFNDIQYKEVKSHNLDYRGKIYDRNYNLLAATISSTSLSANPNKIKNKKIIINKLSKILNLDKKFLNKKFSQKNNFVWIKRNISPLQHKKIIDIGEINLNFHNEKKRVYPFQNAASHIVGYVDIDQIGQAGIERSYNNKLNQLKDIKLTLDIKLQQSVREKLKKTVDLYKAESGLAIVVDMQNGEVLASVSLPDFNPNIKSTYNNNNLINRVIQSNYEMGSTFKPITVAMGFDKNLLNSDMRFDVTESINGISDYNDYKGNGIYDIEKIIVESSNIGTAKIATLIGRENQIDFFKKISFFNKLNFEILETAKPLGNKYNWGNVETMTIGYGHGFAVTPLHLLKAYISISKGYEISPTIIHDDIKIKEKNLIVKKETSEYFLKLLRSVITKTKFTGPRVEIEGYNIGGKTGTAVLVKETGGYYSDRDLTSFIGVFPFNKPKYAVLTILEYPKKIPGSKLKTTGAVVNAPLVKEIILDMINILNIPKEKPKNSLKADINNIYRKNNATL